jgi:hypothetical protein
MDKSCTHDRGDDLGHVGGRKSCYREVLLPMDGRSSRRFTS